MMTPLPEATAKSRVPARLDLAQSLTGLALGLFMWAHLLLVSSILLGEEAMARITMMMEASFLNPSGDGGYPILVTFVAMFIFLIFVAHAGLAMRKFPASWKQHRILRSHIKMMKHGDTTMWYTQVITGFVMFFLGSVHLYVIMTQPDKIGPYASADRFVTGWMWPLYFVLLFAVELHGGIGMYRLAIKWGWFTGKDPRKSRRRLKIVKWSLTGFFLALGLASFAAYVKIGIEHSDRAGERHPLLHTEQPEPSKNPK
jgi:succinate dehydrogenase subunit C